MDSHETATDWLDPYLVSGRIDSARYGAAIPGNKVLGRATEDENPLDGMLV